MKVYYDENFTAVDTVKCCNRMKHYWSLELIFLEPEQLELVNRDGIVFKRCPNCGAKIIIKPSRI